MPVIDDVKKTQEEIKSKGFKYQLRYYVYYYKWPVIFTIIGLIAVISFIVHLVTSKDTGFEVVFINSIGAPEIGDMYDHIDMDTEKYEIYYDDNYYYDGSGNYSQLTIAQSQKLLALTSIGDLDVIISDSTGIDSIYSQDIFMDLRDFFDEDFLKEHEDDLYYVTYSEYTDADTIVETDTVPVGLDISDSNIVNDSTYETTPIYFCIVVNTDHPDYVSAFYSHIYE